MSAYVLTNSQLLVGSASLAGFTGQFETSVEAAMKDAGNLEALGYAIPIPGITKAAGSLKGNADFATGAVGQTFTPAQIGGQYAFSVNPTGTAAAVGDSVTFMRGRLSSFKSPTGPTGEVAGFELNLTGDSAEIDGYIGATLASRTTAGFTGASVQMGAVPATDQLWAALHVTAAAGTNLAITVQSDNATGFPSAATALPFATVSATGWQFIAIPGPMTDDWFRVVATIASGTFTFFVAMGVL